mgnify:CR=1 FL=1
MTSVKQSSEWITGQKLEIRDIEALAIGTWILGTGGGGNPYHSLLNMRELYKSGHRVNLIQPEELDDEALVGVLSNMGAPLVGEERLTDPQFAMKPVLMMEKYGSEDQQEHWKDLRPIVDIRPQIVLEFVP